MFINDTFFESDDDVGLSIFHIKDVDYNRGKFKLSQSYMLTRYD